MEKQIKIQLRDADKLEFTLKETANIGDYICLSEFNEIDFSELQKQINDKNNKLINQRLTELLEEKRKDIINDYKQTKEYKSLKDQINKLTSDIRVESEKVNNAINNYKQSPEYQNLINEKNTLINEKNTLLSNLKLKENELQNQKLKTLEEFRKDKEYIDLKNKIQELTKLNIELESTHKEKLKIKELELEKEFKEKIDQKQKHIDDLERRRNINSKLIGEDLEQWIINEYNKSLQFSEDCCLEKTNKNIEGTKPDFLFKVFFDNDINKIIGSVTIEAKAQKDLLDKTKNATSFDKLDKDRKKHKSDFALLVTEREPNEEFFIKKVHEYENMYMCRPLAMIPFLSIIKIIYKKREEIVKNTGQINFHDRQKILDDFEDMKNKIMNVQIKNISSKLEVIKKNAETINHSANQILESLNIIIDTHIKQLKNQLDQFKIHKIINEIN
ncbi:DUF2130 domain-containing protein [Mycoplasmoides alvi]|uniref:DUF2130 domain-containing protein n=1 Tax=Mycoplasmoides alvi TaxID=78580 RepID=UPI00051AF586|nr:DUF2130 domain-containing protein [Mycoplasmoides alvi]